MRYAFLLIFSLIFSAPVQADMWWFRVGCNDASGSGERYMRLDLSTACNSTNVLFSNPVVHVPESGYVKYFTCDNQSSAGSFTYTLYKNFEATVATCSLTPGQEYCQWDNTDLPILVRVNKGERLSVGSNDTEGVDGGIVSCTVGVKLNE